MRVAWLGNTAASDMRKHSGVGSEVGSENKLTSLIDCTNEARPVARAALRVRMLVILRSHGAFVMSGGVAGKPAYQGIDAPGTVSAWRFANDGTALAFSIVVTVSATHHDEGNAARV
jgi:hypothetical protein